MIFYLEMGDAYKHFSTREESETSHVLGLVVK